MNYWQTIVVALAVSWAIYVLARRIQSVFSGDLSGCGSCQSCPSSSPGDEKLVTLDVPQQSE